MVVVNFTNLILKSTILAIFLFLFTLMPLVFAGSFMVDVYETNANPYSVPEGEEVTISGKVKLVEAPSGYHMVSVEWYVDDYLDHTATYSMRKGEVRSVSWNYDTSGLSKGRHDIKINASVDNTTDEDSNRFYVKDEITLTLDDFDLDPDTICVDESETVDLSVDVALEKGPDDTLVKAKFYMKENGFWDFIDEEEKRLDEDETKNFQVYFDYDADDLDEGSYDVKVVVEAEDEREIEYTTLHVEECLPGIENDVEVGWITINPEFPEIGDTILASFPISLQTARSLPKNVYVRGYVDGRVIKSETMKFQHLETRTFTFNIDTKDYSTGEHTIEVKATVDDVTDSSRRTFTLDGEFDGVHCLDIINIRSEPLKPGKQAKVEIEVSNCGSIRESNIRVKLEAFSRIYYGNVANIFPGDREEIEFLVTIPDDATGTNTFYIRAWNSYTSDSTSKDFVVSFGEPLIEVKPEYQVERCKSNEITFSVVNIGKVTDTFTLSLEGPTWITGIPEEITLEPDERNSITIYAIVPCDADEGYYPITIKARNTKEHSLITNVKVTKPWTWPSLPVGLFVVPSIIWLPWLILMIVLVVFYLFYKKIIRARKRPMF